MSEQVSKQHEDGIYHKHWTLALKRDVVLLL